jgi:hypothetical protein
MNIKEMNFTDMCEPLQIEIRKDIGMRFNGIVTIWNYWIEHCVKYISFTNAGGIIAILTFMNSRSITSLSWCGLALLLFVIGLILVGITIAYMFHRMKNNYDEMITYAEKFYGGNIKWGEFKEKADKASKFNKPALFFGWFSASCFFAGLIIGIISFITYN